MTIKETPYYDPNDEFHAEQQGRVGDLLSSVREALLDAAVDQLDGLRQNRDEQVEVVLHFLAHMVDRDIVAEALVACCWDQAMERARWHIKRRARDMDGQIENLIEDTQRRYMGKRRMQEDR